MSKIERIRKILGGKVSVSFPGDGYNSTITIRLPNKAHHYTTINRPGELAQYTANIVRDYFSNEIRAILSEGECTCPYPNPKKEDIHLGCPTHSKRCTCKGCNEVHPDFDQQCAQKHLDPDCPLHGGCKCQLADPKDHTYNCPLRVAQRKRIAELEDEIDQSKESQKPAERIRELALSDKKYPGEWEPSHIEAIMTYLDEQHEKGN